MYKPKYNSAKVFYKEDELTDIERSFWLICNMLNKVRTLKLSTAIHILSMSGLPLIRFNEPEYLEKFSKLGVSKENLFLHLKEEHINIPESFYIDVSKSKPEEDEQIKQKSVKKSKQKKKNDKNKLRPKIMYVVNNGIASQVTE